MGGQLTLAIIDNHTVSAVCLRISPRGPGSRTDDWRRPLIDDVTVGLIRILTEAAPRTKAVLRPCGGRGHADRPESESSMTPATKHRSFVCFVLAYVIALAAAAIAQPFPSFMLDTVRVVGPDWSGPSSTSSAFADSVGLVIWPSGVRVMGCRVDRSLGLLDSIPIDISGAVGQPSGYRADVASNGRNFLAAWAYSNEGGLEHVMATVIAQNGLVQTRLELAPPCYMAHGVSASSDGANYMVAWTRQDSGAVRVLFVRVASDGRLLDSTPRLVCPAFENRQNNVDVAFGDSCHLAVWWQDNAPGPTPFTQDAVWGSLIRADGTLLDSAGFPVHRMRPGSGLEPAVAFNGRSFIVAWQRDGGTIGLDAARVTSSGHVLDTVPVPVADRIGWPVALGATRDTTLVAWNSEQPYRHVLGRRVDGELRWLDTVPVTLTPTAPQPVYSTNPSVAVGDGFLVVWATCMDGTPASANLDVVGRRLASTGALLDSAPVLISYAANAQLWGDVASDGESFLAVWTDCASEPGSPERILGARFNAAGVVLDRPAIRIGGPGSFNPAVAFGAGVYLVCWETEDDRVCAARLNRGGVLIDTAPIQVCTPSPNLDLPDVAYADSIFLVVWEKTRIQGARVSPAGAVLDSPPLNLDSPGGTDRSPRVAGAGHNFLATWDAGAPPGQRVLARRVGVDGVLLEPEEFTVSWHGGRNRVAYGGGVYFVYIDRQVTFSLVSPDGVVLDTEARAYPPGVGSLSSVTFNGTDFVVAGVIEGRDSAPFDRLWTERISPQGVVLDSAALLLASTPDECINWASAAASDSLGNVAVVFSTFESLNYMTCRVRAVVMPRNSGVGAARGRLVSHRFRVYPNPTSRFVSLETGTPLTRLVRVEILDVAGRRTRELDVLPDAGLSSRLNLDLQGLEPGVFYVRSKSFPGRARVVVAR